MAQTLILKITLRQGMAYMPCYKIVKTMANKGCNNCLHYKIGEKKMWEDDIPSKCLLGKDEEFRLWWEENGRKRNSDEITDMDCFQETKLSEFCNEASQLLDEIRKILNNL